LLEVLKGMTDGFVRRDISDEKLGGFGLNRFEVRKRKEFMAKLG
jgi:hypothetical protein